MCYLYTDIDYINSISIDDATSTYFNLRYTHG
nr:MAG TPA: hypothetical protein [Caudoviricetes sp.]